MGQKGVNETRMGWDKTGQDQAKRVKVRQEWDKITKIGQKIVKWDGNGVRKGKMGQNSKNGRFGINGVKWSKKRQDWGK